MDLQNRSGWRSLSRPTNIAKTAQVATFRDTNIPTRPKRTGSEHYKQAHTANDTMLHLFSTPERRPNKPASSTIVSNELTPERSTRERHKTTETAIVANDSLANLSTAERRKSKTPTIANDVLPTTHERRTSDAEEIVDSAAIDMSLLSVAHGQKTAEWVNTVRTPKRNKPFFSPVYSGKRPSSIMRSLRPPGTDQTNEINSFVEKSNASAAATCDILAIPSTSGLARNDLIADNEQFNALDRHTSPLPNGSHQKDVATTKHVHAKKQPQHKKERKVFGTQSKALFQHFVGMPVERDAFPVVEEAVDLFFKNLGNDLEAYAQHAGRKTVALSDVELLMKRQRFITKNHSMQFLAAKYLPLEYREELIPCISAKGKIYP